MSSIFKYMGSHETEKPSADRYLVTYADLITLLLGLFVILYATARVDEEKYKEFSQAFSQYFNSSDSVLTGGPGVLEGQYNKIPEPTYPEFKKRSFDEVANTAQTALKQFINSGEVKFNRMGSKVVLTFPEKVLFRSGKSEIQPQGERILDTIAKMLKGIDFEVTVDGHTDTDPINSFRYASNWHLSGARAINVGYLLVQKGLPEHILVVRGLSSQRPVSDNASEAGKSLNRRVEITISDKPPNALTTEGYGKKDSTKLFEITKDSL